MSKQQVQRTPRSQPVLIELKALLAKGQEIGYVTLNDLNKALPSEVNSSEQIEGIVATFSELGIQIVDDDDPEEKSPQSADQDAEKQFDLAVDYDLDGDYKQAVVWYRKAAEQGHAIAQFNLGVHLYYGEGLVQDYDQAMRWWRMAAEQGDLDAAEFVRNKGPK